MTVLLTSSGAMPGGQRAHALVGELGSLQRRRSRRRRRVDPGQLAVRCRYPGHGTAQLWQALKYGGPSLLIETVEDLTNVRIDHYSVIKFGGRLD